jgi:predicted MFS family arabinose efflux permease
VTTGLSLLAYTVVQTGDHPWGSGRTLCLLVISAALLAYFVVHEAFVATEPLVPFTLFRNRSVTGANLLQVLAASSTFAMFYFLSLYEQQVLHYSALKTGLVFVPLTAGIIVFAGLGPVLIPRIGVRFAVIIGAVISTGGLLLFAGISPTGGLVGNIIVPSVIVSGGFAILLIPLTIASVAGVAAEATGVASGLLNTTRQLGGALGLAVIGSITTTRTEGRLHAGQAVESALSDGFRLGFAISAGLMAITVVAALLLLSDQGRGERVNLAELAAAGVRD